MIIVAANSWPVMEYLHVCAVFACRSFQMSNRSLETLCADFKMSRNKEVSPETCQISNNAVNCSRHRALCLYPRCILKEGVCLYQWGEPPLVVWSADVLQKVSELCFTGCNQSKAALTEKLRLQIKSASCWVTQWLTSTNEPVLLILAARGPPAGCRATVETSTTKSSCSRFNQNCVSVCFWHDLTTGWSSWWGSLWT